MAITIPYNNARSYTEFQINSQDIGPTPFDNGKRPFTCRYEGFTSQIIPSNDFFQLIHSIDVNASIYNATAIWMQLNFINPSTTLPKSRTAFLYTVRRDTSMYTSADWVNLDDGAGNQQFISDYSSEGLFGFNQGTLSIQLGIPIPPQSRYNIAGFYRVYELHYENE
jgi:hypothetical protein